MESCIVLVKQQKLINGQTPKVSINAGLCIRFLESQKPAVTCIEKDLKSLFLAQILLLDHYYNPYWDSKHYLAYYHRMVHTGMSGD